MEEMEACVAAGESPIAWMRNEYTIPEKNRIIAWYRLHLMTKVHSADAEAKAAKEKSKQNG